MSAVGTRPPLIILGAVGNCLDIAEAARAGGFEVVGFLDDDAGLQGRTLGGVPVLGRLEDAGRHTDASFVLGIGGPDSFRAKKQVLDQLGIPVERFATVIHPSCVVSESAQIGPGSAILSHCSIGHNVTIGTHVVMLQNTVVGHDSEIGDLTILAAGVSLSGKVTIGTQCYIGVAVAMKDGVSVEPETLIGAGSVVVSDIRGCRVAFGVPAKAAEEM